MAEVLGEHWSGQILVGVGRITLWKIGSWLVSSSPLAWWCTDGFSLGIDARHDLFNIIGESSWGTEV
jgi:hypothetical protein